jgi:crotonobetainyl-CoA:carnitine CoA-transferase CaiB-like acyl-CoA transferase
MSVTGEPDAPPTKCGVSIVDFAGGILGALALTIGLFRARTHGIGGDVDVALLDVALSMLNYMGSWSLNREWTPARHPNGAHQSLLPSQSFQTRDGWLVVMVMKEKFWTRLTECLERPDLCDDPRFRTFADRLANRDALAGVLVEAFRRRSTGEWLERLRGQVPVAPVYSVEDALADEHTTARQMIVEIEHPVFGALRQIGCPIKLPGTTPRYAPGAPLGADTAAVLGEIGVEPDELAALHASGVV